MNLAPIWNSPFHQIRPATDLLLAGLDEKHWRIASCLCLNYTCREVDLRRQGTPIPTNDLWIAATALETGARLISYDARFQHVPGLIVIAP